MDQRQMGRRFDNDWSEDELKEIYDDITSAVTIPVNVAIKGGHRILDMDKMEELLREAESITIQDCGCRVRRGNCSAPLGVCLSLNEEAEQMLKNGRDNPRRATLEEALDALRRSHEAGLVHMAYTMEREDRPTIICSCCSCCCHTLSGLIRFGLAKHVVTSDKIAETDFNTCSNCGQCVERCQFRAREIDDGRLIYDPERCFGCGLCVTTCPTGSIKLVERA